jgi:hypothetical protein
VAGMFTTSFIVSLPSYSQVYEWQTMTTWVSPPTEYTHSNRHLSLLLFIWHGKRSTLYITGWYARTPGWAIEEKVEWRQETSVKFVLFKSSSITF